MAYRLEVVQDAGALAKSFAAEFFRLAGDAMGKQAGFRVALAGGTTPRAAYERIAMESRKASGSLLDWDRIHVFWGDERMVPPDDPQSNYGMARDAMLSRVPIPKANVHPIPTDDPDASADAARYEATLREQFARDKGPLPRFDLVLLGLGADGHTASLFPGSPALADAAHLAVATSHPETGEPRVTLTLPVLNNAAAVIVLVSGREKSETLERVVRRASRGRGDPLLPAHRLNPSAGTLLWLADKDAAPWARAERAGPKK